MATHVPGVHVDEAGHKTFIPLENNPEVFTDLVHRLGLSPELGFHDVYSLDDPDLLAFIPRPAHALIFISPADVYNRVREHDKRIDYDGSGADEPVMWFKQTIGNACGLMALVHSVANGSAKNFITPDSPLSRILAESVPLKPEARAAVLYNSQALEQAHMASAHVGSSAAPAAEEPNSYHFIAFVKGDDGHLWELEGGWDGPIDRGSLDEDEDCLSERALDLGPRRYVKTAMGSVEFSIVALTS